MLYVSEWGMRSERETHTADKDGHNVIGLHTYMYV